MIVPLFHENKGGHFCSTCSIKYAIKRQIWAPCHNCIWRKKKFCQICQNCLVETLIWKVFVKGKKTYLPVRAEWLMWKPFLYALAWKIPLMQFIKRKDPMPVILAPWLFFQKGLIWTYTWKKHIKSSDNLFLPVRIKN